MLKEINLSVQPFNGQSHDVEYLNKQLERFVANQSSIIISGETGIGKYRAARWLHAQRTGEDGLERIKLQSRDDLQSLLGQSINAIYILIDAAFAQQHLDEMLLANIPRLYIGIATSNYFKVLGKSTNVVHIPALRERVLDIPIITHILLSQLAEETGNPVPNIQEIELQQLQRHPLPGNVRELKELLRGMF